MPKTLTFSLSIAALKCGLPVARRPVRGFRIECEQEPLAEPVEHAHSASSVGNWCRPPVPSGNGCTQTTALRSSGP